jgi:catechol 2,3-dioxygenase-like lactoylglutathione lyase family enzyme
MLDSADLIAFAASTDLPRSRRFYETVLGLRVVVVNDYACVVDAHGTSLRITAVNEVAHPGYTVLGWRVTDIASVVAALEDQGVTFTRYPGADQDAHGIWAAPGGDRVAWFTDPDGNVLSVTEFGEPPVVTAD